ncbi:hypothetical protein D9M68_866150 [compost metagenome]
MLGGFLDGSFGDKLGQQRDGCKHDCAGECRDPEPEMEGEADGNVEGQPGQIEERGRAISGEERADGVEIAKGLGVAGTHRRLKLQAEDRIVDAWRNCQIETIGNAHQETPA